jgi:hypothetical protein
VLSKASHFPGVRIFFVCDSLYRESVRRHACACSGQHRHSKKADVRPYSKWDSNPRSQCLSGTAVIGYLTMDTILNLEQGFRSRYSDLLRAGRLMVRSLSPGRVKNFLFSTSSRTALEPTQPPIQWVTGALSPGVKRPGREADHSPSTSMEVRKTWIHTSTPHTPSWRSV